MLHIDLTQYRPKPFKLLELISDIISKLLLRHIDTYQCKI
jgi:hypothetical protein